MPLLVDAVRIVAALVLCALALAAVADRHQALILHLGRVGEVLAGSVVWAATFGRVRLPQIVRTSRRRAARRRRLARNARQGAPAPSAPGPSARTWQVGREDAAGWSDDDAPPGLG